MGILFIFVISLYGIFFKVLHIDLLRLKKQSTSYWLDIDEDKAVHNFHAILMYTLGISCYYHDSAASLLKDGKVLAAVEEERFSRKKI